MSEQELNARGVEAKAAGDTAYKSGQYEAAIEHYSKGISFDPNAAVLYGNRSAAYFQVSRMEEALNDAEKCLSLGMMGINILARKAKALQALKRYSEALGVWMEVSHLDQNFELANKGIDFCQVAIAGRDMLNKNAPFTKKDASNLLGEFGRDFDRTLFDDFLSTFLPLPGKPLPGPDASQKVPFMMTGMIVQEIPAQRRNDSSRKVQVRGHYCLPRGAFLRMEKDDEFASKVCHHAFDGFIRAAYTCKCANCGKPSRKPLGQISVKFFPDPRPGLHADAHDTFCFCDDPKCEAIVLRAIERTTAFETRRCCAACTKLEDPVQLFLACSRCNIAFYCNKSCQRSHWKIHKPVCKAASGKSNTK